MKHFTLAFVLFFLTWMGSTALAQGGTNDPDFNVFNDPVYGNGAGFGGFVYSTSLQSDGKIIVGGAYPTFNGTVANNLIRLNTDGTVDNTFNIGTGCDYSVFSTLVQPDGKIIIAGTFTEFNGSAAPGIARLNSDGSLDASFNPGTGFDYTVYSMQLQSDGKIIAAGEFTSYNGTSVNKIVRLNSDGSIDAGFNIGTGFSNPSWAICYVNSILLQPDGKILAGGYFENYNGNSAGYFTRLNANGSFDASFNVGGAGFNDEVHSISLKPDGSILVGGWFTGYNDDASMRFAHLLSDGSFDASFNVGNGADGRVYSSVVLPDGKIVITGTFTNFDGSTANGITCLQSNGAIDPGFDASLGLSGYGFTLNLQNNNDIIISGSFTAFNNSPRGSIARLHPTGNIDDTFLISAGFTQQVNTMLELENDQLLVGGDFHYYNDQSVKFLSRLNEDGTLDPTFNMGTGINGAVFTLEKQTDGKILIGGNFTSLDGVTCNKIARINPDGSIDLTFNTGNGFNTPVRTIAVQQDGKILVGGQFSMFNDSIRQKIVRLNSDGTLDESFNIGTGIGGTIVRTITILPDNRILVGGVFGSYNDSLINNLVLLNPDGSIESNFDAELVGGSLGDVKVTLLQNDGKILIGGNFTTFNNQPVNRLVRLNSDLTLDPTFSVSTGCNGNILSIASQPNGKILLGGVFDQFGAASTQRIVRLMNDGTLDNSFDSGTGFNAQVNTLCLQGSGKVAVGGQFYTYNGINRNRIARLLLCSPSSFVHSATACDSYTYNNETFTTTGSYTQTLTNLEGCDSTITVNVTINQTPNATVVDNGTGTLTASNGTTFQWINCITNQAIAGATSQNFSPIVNGSYAAIISNGSCTDTADCITVNYIGLEDAPLSMFSVSPNPTNDIVTIRIPVSGATLNITNAQGNLIQSVTVKDSEKFDLSDYAPGVYFFQLKYGDNTFIERVIKK